MESAPISILGGGSHQVFRDAHIHAAGRDVLNVNYFNLSPQVFAPRDNAPQSDVAVKHLRPQPRDEAPALRRQQENEFVVAREGLALETHQQSKSKKFKDKSLWKGLQSRFSTRPPTNDLQVAEPAQPGSQSRAEPSLRENECDVSVSTIEDTGHLHFLRDCPRTSSQVYVRNMLSAGEGFPCWNPSPTSPFVPDRGLCPGDVGTICPRDGFQRIFNIWESKPDGSVAPGTWSLPQVQHLSPSRWFTTGHTFSKGVAASVQYGEALCPSFTFSCSSSEGSALAITSPADLEALSVNDVVALRAFIIKNAASLYRHALESQGMYTNQPLYIVTGCVKTETWAMAAYDSPMEAPYNKLHLTPRVETSAETYVWTERGSADVRCSNGAKTPGVKDQCLFLRGFTLTASDTFWNELNRASTSPDSSTGSGRGPDSEEKEGNGGGPEGKRRANGDCTHGSSPGHAGSQSYQWGEASVASFPYSEQQMGTLNPSERINQSILNATMGSNFALSHDDDWRFQVNGLSDAGGDWANLIQELESHRGVTTENGVSMLGDVHSRTLLHLGGGLASDRHLFESPSLAEACDGRGPSKHARLGVAMPKHSECSKGFIFDSPLVRKTREVASSTKRARNYLGTSYVNGAFLERLGAAAANEESQTESQKTERRRTEGDMPMYAT